MESSDKQISSPMPVMYIKAVAIKPDWTYDRVGYMRYDQYDLFQCILYFIVFLYVYRRRKFSAQLHCTVLHYTVRANVKMKK